MVALKKLGCVLRKLSCVAALGLFTTVWSVNSAGAVVVSSFDVLSSGPISVGDSITARLNLVLYADSSYYNPWFNGGSATIYDGNGGSQTFNVGSGGTSRQFDFNSVVNAAGTFLASFVFNANYAESYNSWEYLYSRQVVVGYGYYSCGHWGWDTCSYPVYGWQPVYGNVTRTAYRYPSPGSGSEAYTVSAVPEVSAVPIPTALPLLASGVLGLMWFGRRRGRQLFGRILPATLPLSLTAVV